MSIVKQLDHASALRSFLRRRRRRLVEIRLRDIDKFVIDCARRYARTTTADICSSIRAFLRFLHATGRLSNNLAPSVTAPVVRRGGRPARALPWSDVRRILGAVDRSTRGGRRDFALLLFMAVYGMGAGEVTSLTLGDIDWRAGCIRVTRPKTGVVTSLPLLPPVARAVVTYLRQGRPRATRSRRLFVRTQAPYDALTTSSAIRHIIIKHARVAGVTAAYLGSHVLRHSHATRQINEGALPKVVSDILGHRRPESTSSYVRVAVERLRELALEVPSWP